MATYITKDGKIGGTGTSTTTPAQRTAQIISSQTTKATQPGAGKISTPQTAAQNSTPKVIPLPGTPGAPTKPTPLPGNPNTPAVVTPLPRSVNGSSISTQAAAAQTQAPTATPTGSGKQVPAVGGYSTGETVSGIKLTPSPAPSASSQTTTAATQQPSYSAAYPTYQQTAYTPQQVTDNSQLIRDMVNASVEANVAAAQGLIDKADNDYRAAIARVAPEYDAQRRATQGTSDIQRANLNEMLAARGINTQGAAAQMDIATSNALTNQLSALNQAEADMKAEIELDYSNRKAEIAAQIEQMRAQGRQLETQMLIEEYNRLEAARIDENRYAAEWAANEAGRAYQAAVGAYNAGYQNYRDTVGDSQWQQQFDYGMTRDAVSDSQWQQSFDYGKTQDDRDYALRQEALALQKQTANNSQAANDFEQNAWYASQTPDVQARYDTLMGTPTEPWEKMNYQQRGNDALRIYNESGGDIGFTLWVIRGLYGDAAVEWVRTWFNDRQAQPGLSGLPGSTFASGAMSSDMSGMSRAGLI